MADAGITVGLIIQPQGAHLGAYLDALAKLDDIAAVFVADSTGETEAQCRKVLGDKFRGLLHKTRVMLTAAAPQLALISVEAVRGPDEIEAALDAGCHVLAEKPACVRIEDFEPLARKAESKHRNIMLALANRLTPPIQEARRLIKSGLLGKIYGAELHLIADQTRLKNPAYHQNWFADKARSGGGHLIWLGIHWIDLVTYLTDLKITHVAGMIQNIGGQSLNVEDSATLLLRFDNGAAGTLTSGYYLDKGYHQHLQIWGEQGWLRLGDLDKTPLVYFTTHPTRAGKEERFEYPSGQGGYTPLVRAAARFSAGKGEAPLTTADSLRVLQTVFAGYAAAKSGCIQAVS